MVDVTPPAANRVPVNIVLYLLVLVTAAATIFVSGKVLFDDDPSGGGSAESVEADPAGDDLFAAVIDSATTEVLAFMNVDYRKFEETTEAVLAGATGRFAKEYEKTAESLRRLVTRNESVTLAKILSAGVVAAHEDRALVLVAASGTAQNVNIGEGTESREWRVQVELRFVDGEWLTSDLRFVS